MKFKDWLLNEIVELAKPSSKVQRRRVIRDPGTNVAKPRIKFEWKTKLGNKVTLFFDVNGDDSYTVIFYVNDIIDSYGGHTGDFTRDPEILSGVFYLLKHKANQLKAKNLNFSAYNKDEYKILKNLNFEKLKPEALNQLNFFEQSLRNHKITMIEPSQKSIDVHKKLNHKQPTATPDLTTDVWIRWVENIKKSINNNQYFDQELDNFKGSFYNKRFDPLKIDLTPLIKSLEKLDVALKSHSPQGYQKITNRRKNIYSKLLNRYMADEWNIENSGSHFVLKRKNEF